MLRGASAHKAFKDEDINPHIGLGFIGTVRGKGAKESVLVVFIVHGTREEGMGQGAGSGCALQGYPTGLPPGLLVFFHPTPTTVILNHSSLGDP